LIRIDDNMRAPSEMALRSVNKIIGAGYTQHILAPGITAKDYYGRRK